VREEYPGRAPRRIRYLIDDRVIDASGHEIGTIFRHARSLSLNCNAANNQRRVMSVTEN
jgi:hypothetical protein